jgi:hypothetical protein
MLQSEFRNFYAIYQSIFLCFINYFLSSTPSWRGKTYSLSIVIDKELDVRLLSFLCVTPVSAATMGFEQSRQIAGMKSGPVIPVWVIKFYFLLRKMDISSYIMDKNRKVWRSGSRCNVWGRLCMWELPMHKTLPIIHSYTRSCTGVQSADNKLRQTSSYSLHESI